MKKKKPRVGSNPLDWIQATAKTGESPEETPGKGGKAEPPAGSVATSPTRPGTQPGEMKPGTTQAGEHSEPAKPAGLSPVPVPTETFKPPAEPVEPAGITRQTGSVAEPAEPTGTTGGPITNTPGGSPGIIEILKRIEADQVTLQEGLRLLKEDRHSPGGLKQDEKNSRGLGGREPQNQAGSQGRGQEPGPATETPGSEEKNQILKKTENYLKKILSKETKLPEQKIDAGELLEKYGIDSVTVMNLTRELEEHFGELSKTLFFEYKTLRELSGYLIENHREKLQEKIGWEAQTPPGKAESAPVDTGTGSKPAPKRTRFITPGAAAGKPGYPGDPGEPREEEIAIIGISGRYPGAKNLEIFWENLREGRDSIEEIPAERWDYRPLYDPDREKTGKMYSKWGGFIREADKFDPLFFNMSPREAELTDPQERIFLETVWHTVEDAGYTRQSLRKYRVGVYVGIMWTQYQLLEGEVNGEKIVPSASLSSIANRVSYFFDFTGPSIALDTMCSSSLTAIHLACESLRRGESDLAAAGGVNLSLHENKYILLSQQKFASTDGRCRSFGAGGDGYVPGEGVGAVLLKRLSEAITDRDHIYAVIKGAAINHGGRTNGYSVPNPRAQAEVIEQALEKAKIDPRTIGYLEAHGTGTSLGDPIEIAALEKAYGKYTPDKQYCSIGSVKSNIGHLESAAGIASLTKIILQMKHKQLVPSLHSAALNPYIDFQASPFQVQQRLAEWKPLRIKEGEEEKTCPRRAGISSFGAGGTNVHILIEEYRDPEAHVTPRDPIKKQEQVIVLSAKNPERLKEYAGKLVDYLEKNSEPANLDLAEIAYTLQVGREAMTERLALVVPGAEELKIKLKHYCRGDNDIENLYKGNIKKDKDKVEFLAEGREGEEFLKILIGDRKLNRVAHLWVCGAEIRWESLYTGDLPRRISLPVYPFARERYWIPGDGKATTAMETRRRPAARLHPLIEANISTLEEEKFSTILAGYEFYLKDHKVAGQKVLPGVVYLEMARAAGEIAGQQEVRKIKDVVWLKPIPVTDGPREIYITVTPDPRDEYVEYRVSSMGEGSSPILHSRGKLLYGNGDRDRQPPEDETIDIEAVKKRSPGHIAGEEFYKLFRAAGLEYGPSFRPVQEVAVNEKEALARLVLPGALKGDFHEYLLHPALLDGALQTVMGLADRENANPGVTFLPYALGELEITAPLEEIAYAYVAPAEDARENPTSVKQFDIRLVQETGRVAVKIKEFTLREIKPVIKTAPAEIAAPPNPVQSPVNGYGRWWEKTAINPGAGETEAIGHVLLFDIDGIDGELTRALEKRLPADHGGDGNGSSRILVVKPGKKYRDLGNRVYEVEPGSEDDYRHLVKELQAREIKPAKIIHMWSRRDGDNLAGSSIIKEHLDRGIYSVFYLTRALMEQKPQETIRLWYCIRPGEENPGTFMYSQSIHAAVDGFARTLRQENPKYIYKTVEVARPHAAPTQWAEILTAEMGNPGTDEYEIRYDGGERYVKRMQPVQLGNETGTNPGEGQPAPLQDRGVYILTGGLGALGSIFARYLAGQVKARLVLTDYTDLAPGKKTRIEALEALGSEVMYIKADISNREEVKNLIAAVKTRFKAINGIIHCAGVNRDSMIIKKTGADFAAVLAPKVYGTCNLDEYTAGENLDFFVLFSSTAALGNAGQADYAYANSFMDHFSTRREELRSRQKRTGKTLSINWPLWKEGGMRVDPQTMQWMEKKFGMVPLETTEGLRFFHDALGARTNPLLCMAGDREKLNQSLGIRDTIKPGTVETAPGAGVTEALPGPRPQQPQPPEGEKFREKVEQELIRICSEVLKVKITDLDTTEQLGNYGMDSIMMIAMMNRIESQYGGTMEPNAMTEYPTIKELAAYLVRQGVAKPPAAVREEPGGQIHPQGAANPAAADRENPEPGEHIRQRKPGKRFTRDADSPVDPGEQEMQKIAVIGMACRFPQSNTPEQFWENLEKGRHLVTEVPAARWKIAEHYSPDRQAPHKTYSKWGGYIDGVELFDAGFFGIPEAEALVMDPQQRILLELTRELLDRSGYTGKETDGTRTSVWLGGGESSYIKNHYDKIPGDSMKRLLVSSIQNMIAARISDYYNLKGSSQTIDTACSSSLVAIHHACRELRRGEAEMAIAGGIELLLDPYLHIGFSKAGVLSDEGKLYVFDERAKGFVLGEGVGLVLLKPYWKAVEDGDRVMGVILGSAVNNDGHTMGLTTPNLEGQKEVIKKALEVSRVNPGSITYVETHGTGTLLGDPIEIKALTQVYRENTREKGYCAVGSVKSNMGHLIRAAAIPSFIKVMLALENKKIPPTLHCQKPHPRFRFEDSPFYPITGSKPWEPREGTRRAGISSFGFGGTNCHMIVEETREQENPAYVPRRSALPVTRFKRRRYWLGKEIIDEEKIKDTVTGHSQLELIKDLEQGKVTVARVMELLNIS